MSIANVVTLGFGPGASGTSLVPTLGFSIGEAVVLVHGPLIFEAAQVFCPGAVAAQVFVPGAVAAQVFTPGAEAAMVEP